MVTALKQTAIVEEGGRIEIRNTQFRPGARVEVIVLQEQAEESSDAAWDRLLSDPAKSANFAKWAQGSLAEGDAEPLDLNRL